LARTGRSRARRNPKSRRCCAKGRRAGRFLLLGSASIDLLRQSSETLVARIAHVELTPLLEREIRPRRSKGESPWVRGVSPHSVLAAVSL
jgi:predicted AAA+ superfamily ATPase